MLTRLRLRYVLCVGHDGQTFAQQRLQMTQHVLRVDHVEVNVNVEGKILDGARHGHCGRVKVGSIAAVAVIAAVVGALQFAPAAAYARAVALKHESRAAVVLV